MGLFSSKTRVFVASSAYNLAGDEDTQPNMIRSTVMNTVISGEGSVGENLRNVILYGPGSRPRAFFRWAKDNYAYGMPTASISAYSPVDVEKTSSGLLPILQADLNENQQARVISALIDDADVQYWAEAWMNQNHPEIPREGWFAEWSGETLEIVIYGGAEDEEGEELGRLPGPEDLIWGAADPERKLLYASYQIHTTDPVSRQVTLGPVLLHTYRIGSGNVVFDNLEEEVSQMDEFFPTLPLMLDKKFIDDESLEEEFANVKKGFRRLTGGKIERLLEQIRENDNLADLDAAYIVQGVSLNTKNKIGHQYIYRFFKLLMEQQESAISSIDLPDATPPKSHLNWLVAWERWIRVHQNMEVNSPIFGTKPPVLMPVHYSPNGQFELQVRSDDLLKADFRIEWNKIIETSHIGNAKTFDGDTTRGLLKTGEYWIAEGPPIKRPAVGTTTSSGGPEHWVTYEDVPQVYLFHQFSKRRYRRLALIGVKHKNYVYGGTAVIIKAEDALKEEADEDSPFLVPLHMPTLKSLGMAKAGQLCTASSFMVLNSYKLVKQKWYQRGIFRFIFSIAMIALSFLMPGAGAIGAKLGVFGTNAAVGAALGASAATAALVGAIANGIAAMVIQTLVGKVVSKISGKLGAILGTLISFVAMTYGAQLANHGNLAVNWGSVIRADNLLNLTSTMSKAYSNWLALDTARIYDSFEELADEYKDSMEEIEKLSKEVLGVTRGEINPMLLVDATEHFGESSEAFLTRTLMTGSDIAELSFSLVENFVNLSLELPKARSSSLA